MRYDAEQQLGDLRTVSYNGVFEAWKYGALKQPHEIMAIIDNQIEDYSTTLKYKVLKVTDEVFVELNKFYNGEIFRKKVKGGYLIKVTQKRANQIIKACQAINTHG